MPLYNFKCTVCSEVFEGVVGINERRAPCHCGGVGRKMFTPSLATTPNSYPAWAASIRDVVSKDPSKPHCQEFLKNPSRENLERWKKVEGVRNLEPGESQAEPKPTRKLSPESKRKILKKMAAEKRVEVKSKVAA